MARRALGPATMELVGAVEAAVGGPMLVACSGGPDSLALAAAAAIVGRRRQLGVRAVVVDHQLQPGSEEVATRVVSSLAELNVLAEVVRVDVKTEGVGYEAGARAARYAALAAAARPGEVVLLGHTLDDQAETVLLGLARGSGPRSLAGMAERRGVFCRPLLNLRSQTTLAACAELGLQPWQDPHNADPRFARSRVRSRVMPILEAELGPGIAQALARTALLARADADLLDDLARAELAGQEPGGLDCSWLAGLPPALLGRVLRDWLRGQGALDVSAAHIRAVTDLVTDWHGQAWVEVPGLAVVRQGGRLHVRQP